MKIFCKWDKTQSIQMMQYLLRGGIIMPLVPTKTSERNQISCITKYKYLLNNVFTE